MVESCHLLGTAKNQLLMVRFQNFLAVHYQDDKDDVIMFVAILSVFMGHSL